MEARAGHARATIPTSCELPTGWSTRKADNAILFAEEIDISAADGTFSLTIEVYHKKLDDTGDGTAVGAPITLDGGATGFKHTRVIGLARPGRNSSPAPRQSRPETMARPLAFDPQSMIPGLTADSNDRHTLPRAGAHA